MRSTIATVLAAILLLIGAPAAFAATPSNDTMANATTIAGLPFNVTPDLSGSTVEPGENVDCLFPSTKTVWYRYVVTQKQLLQVDVNSADPDAGVRIYYEYSGSAPALGNCVSLQYSGFQLMVQPVTTLWFQLSVNAGSDATLAVTSLPLLHVSATLDATATYNPKAGTVSIGGTITCSITASGQMFATLRQRQGRAVAVSQGSSDQVACGPAPTRFSATLLGSVTAGLATADWSVSAGRFGPPDQFDHMTGGPTTISITKR